MFMPRSFGWFLLTTVWSCFPPWKDLSRHYCDLVPLQSDRVEQVWRCISILSLFFLAVSFSKATALSHLFTLPPLLQLNLTVSLHQNSAMQIITLFAQEGDLSLHHTNSGFNAMWSALQCMFLTSGCCRDSSF